MEYKAGDSLCGCRLLRKCGAGAYGEVWLAEDTIGALVALKVLYDRGRYSRRELNGLKNYKDCNHPNLLKIRHVEITGDKICYTMDAADDLNRGEGEYLPDTLANRLKENGRLDGREIADMLNGLLDGLEELHKHRLVHRDIKPDNILWVNGRPTLADVGLVAQDGKGSLIGTPGFMSPKLLSGKGQADASDDFYALGKVIYCALTGLPVDEYPSIPVSMTISTNASLSRAFRESCQLPIRSSAEFRRLLQEKTSPENPKGKTSRTTIRPGAKLLPILLLLILMTCSVFIFFVWRKTADGTPCVPQSGLSKKEGAELNAELSAVDAQLTESKTQMKTLEKKFHTAIHGAAGAEYLSEIQDRTMKFFQEEGIIPAKDDMLHALLHYRVMPGRKIRELLERGCGDPRLPSAEIVYPETAKIPSSVERELSEMFEVAYCDFDPEQVLEDQNFWRSQPGPPVWIQQTMLETDPLMQALALDVMIRDLTNTILKNGRFRNGEKNRLGTLFELRHGLLEPKTGKPSFQHLFAE